MNFKNKKGITLIALVITIIVLLILAGVALSLVLGEEGIVARTTKSRDVHNIAGIEEKANLAYHNSLIGGYAQDGVYHPVDLGTVLAQLVADGDITSATPAGGTSITGFTLSETSVELGIGDSATVSAVPTIGEGNGDYEVVIDGQTYLAHMESANIVIDKDPVTSGGPNFEISNVSSSNAAVSAEKTSATVVTVIANSTGNATITVSCGSVSETFTVTVSTKYTVNLYENSTATTPTAISVVEGTKASEATGYAVPTAPEGQVFDKWLLRTAVTGNAVNSDATSLLNNVTQNLDVYATFKTPGWGDLHPANEDYIADFGKIVSGYTGNATIEARIWRLFYADTSNAYLISDYIGSQGLNSISGFSDASGDNISTLGKNLNPKCSATFWTTNPSYNNKKGTAVLLNDDPENSPWKVYKNSCANWAIGAPTVEMFIASYNATHTAEAITAYKESKEAFASETLTETQLDSTVGSATSCGYKVKKGNEGFSFNTSGLGNSSTLDKAIYCPKSGYWWLASPSAYGRSYVLSVSNGNSGNLNYDAYDHSLGVRPLVSVPLSNIGTGEGKIVIEDF